MYNYKNTIIYALFDKTNFINRKTNNSSAHISTFDLLNAYQQGVFVKKNTRNNIIYVVKQECVKSFFEKHSNNENTVSKEVLMLNKFKDSLNVKYHGLDCYKEMIADNYINKY